MLIIWVLKTKFPFTVNSTPFNILTLNSYRANAGNGNSASYLDISIFDGVLSPTTVSGYYDSLKTKWGI